VWVVYHRRAGEETFYRTLRLEDSQIDALFALYKQDGDCVICEEGETVKRLLTSRFELIALRYSPQIELVK
jgi:hypothetical protein